VCSRTQNAAFATGLAAPCWAVRIRPNGEVVVACSSQVYRLSSTGAVVQTYANLGSNLYDLTLDGDNSSFWTGDATSNAVFRVDIGSGSVRTSFAAQTPAGAFLDGVAVVGQLNVAGAAATATPTPTATATSTSTPRPAPSVTDIAPGRGPAG